MYCMVATTGHKGQLVFPMYTSTPFPSWSTLDLLECTLSDRGSYMLSMAMSPHGKCLVWSKDFSGDIVIPSEQKKPKKQWVATAHIIMMSLFVC